MLLIVPEGPLSTSLQGTYKQGLRQGSLTPSSQQDREFKVRVVFKMSDSTFWSGCPGALIGACHLYSYGRQDWLCFTGTGQLKCSSVGILGLREMGKGTKNIRTHPATRHLLEEAL